MVLLYAWKGKELLITYIFAHEMTHAFVGLLFFAHIHRVSVKETGGFVELNKTNLVIVLAPYCAPFYLLLAAVLRAACVLLIPGIIPENAWMFLFGLLAAFHLLYTLSALLSIAQPDIQLYGRLFSYWLILCVNLFFASLALTATGRVEPQVQGKQMLASSLNAYSVVGRTTYNLTHWVITKVSPHESRR